MYIVSIDIGIIGATGNVGREITKQMLSNKIAAKNLFLAASEKSVGSVITVGKENFTIYDIQKLPKCEIYVFATESHISKKYIPTFASTRAFILDSSSALRANSTVPLIVAPINKHLINKETKIYSHANCIASPLSLTISPLLQFEPEHIYVSTYQSASGAGLHGIQELQQNTMSIFNKETFVPKVFPRSLAFNAFPEIGHYESEGSTGEEKKINAEVQKILNTSLNIHVTAVRIPTLRGHGMSVCIHFRKTFILKDIIHAFSTASSIAISSNGYHTPVEVCGSDNVWVGRIEQTSPTHLRFWACSDNIRRGAATDIVETALLLMNLFQ